MGFVRGPLAGVSHEHCASKKEEGISQSIVNIHFFVCTAEPLRETEGRKIKTSRGPRLLFCSSHLSRSLPTCVPLSQIGSTGNRIPQSSASSESPFLKSPKTEKMEWPTVVVTDPEGRVTVIIDNSTVSHRSFQQRAALGKTGGNPNASVPTPTAHPTVARFTPRYHAVAPRPSPSAFSRRKPRHLTIPFPPAPFPLRPTPGSASTCPPTEPVPAAPPTRFAAHSAS
jgi:hypothetical protein